jgi:hypothetical protein
MGILPSLLKFYLTWKESRHSSTKQRREKQQSEIVVTVKVQLELALRSIDLRASFRDWFSIGGFRIARKKAEPIPELPICPTFV